MSNRYDINVVGSRRSSISILKGNEKVFQNYGTTYTKDLHDNELNTEHKNDPPIGELIPYPKGVFFMLISKFFESFSANGVRTVLALYLRDSLKYSESISTLVLHSFNFFGQFCPIFGGIIADSYLGNVRTIFVFMFFYGIGWFGLLVANIPINGIELGAFIFVGLFLIATGNGNIRGCITSLGAQQFKVPEQNEQLSSYFTHYYVLYTWGVLLSKMIPPSVRAQTHCFGKNDCYLAVFGVLAGSFFFCWIVFLLGLCFYKKERPCRENIMMKVTGCIWYATVQKIKGNTPPDVNWMKASVGRYSDEFVDEVAAYMQILKLYLPLPIYWSLLTQVDSTWTFQASQLNTVVFGVTIQADQTKAIGGILLLLFICIWERIFVPLLDRWGRKIVPLRSVTYGGICAVLSFIFAGILQIKIQNNVQTTNNTEMISVLWQFPQYCLLMWAEVLISIPGLKFAFTQAPKSMKSVLTATWFLNNAMGNLIVVIITEIKPFQLQSNEFFLYAGLMLVGIIIFTGISSTYVYREEDESEDICTEKFVYLSEDKLGSTDALVSMKNNKYLNTDNNKDDNNIIVAVSKTNTMRY